MWLQGGLMHKHGVRGFYSELLSVIIYKVSKTLGHKNVSTTKKYVQEVESSRALADSVDWLG